MLGRRIELASAMGCREDGGGIGVSRKTDIMSDI